MNATILANAAWMLNRGETIERLGWMLLHFLWQGAAAAALLAVMLILLQRRSAVTRYRVACVIMLAMTAAPAVTYWGIGLPVRATTPAHAKVHRAMPIGTSQADALDSDMPELATGVAPTSVVQPPGTGIAAFPWVVTGWTVGVVLLSLWRLGGWIHLRRLCRKTRKPDAFFQDALARLSQRAGITRTIRLAQAAWVQVPAVVGWWQPILLLPVGVISGLTPQQLEALLAHELAHIRRWDALMNIAQVAVETLLFYHPAVWWISARIREERENCCDDLAADLCGDKLAYAEALVTMEELRGLPAHLALSARGGNDRGALARRVHRLLGLEAPIERGRSRSLLAALIAMGCVVLPLVMMTPSVRAEKTGAATQPTTLPTTARATGEFGIDATPVQPEDLVVGPAKDYVITRNDLLTIEFTWADAGKVTTKTVRVSETGNINLPYVDKEHVEGVTEAALTRSLNDKYAALNRPAQISVMVVEPMGRAYYIRGMVQRPGKYVISEPDYRLVDAITQAGDVVGEQKKALYVIRKEQQGDKTSTRIIGIPIERLLAGDLNLNVVVRPKDTIFILPQPMTQITLFVAADGLTFRGEKTTWDQLPRLLDQVPEKERASTMLVLTPASDDITLRQWNDAETKAAALANRCRIGEFKAARTGDMPPAQAPANRGGDDGNGGNSKVPSLK